MTDEQYKCIIPVNAANGGYQKPTEHTPLIRANGEEAEKYSSVVTKTYPMRWFVLFVFSLHLAIGNALWVSISPINVVVACYYDVSLFWTYALAWVFMLVYVLFFIPAARFLDTLGLRAAIIVSGCVNAIGTWLRFAGTGKRTFCKGHSLKNNFLLGKLLPINTFIAKAITTSIVKQLQR